MISPDRILRHVNILTFGRLPASGQQTILSQPHQESVRRFFEDLARYLAPSGPAIQPEQPFSKFGRLFVARVFWPSLLEWRASARSYWLLRNQGYYHQGSFTFSKRHSVVTGSGQPVTAPDPNGMSGGAIFGVQINSAAVQGKFEPKLIGISTDWPNKKEVFGTNIAMVMAIIRDAYKVVLPPRLNPSHVTTSN